MSVEQRFKQAANLFQSGQFEQAQQILSEIIELDHSFSYAFNLQGAIAVQNQQFDDAERLFKQAISLNNQAFDFYLNLGQLYLVQQNAAAAMPLLEKSLILNPNQSDIRQQVIQHFLSHHKHKEAYQHIQAFLDRQPSPQLMIIAAQLAVKQGLFQQAMEMLKRLEPHSQQFQLWEYVAVQALQQGHLDIACRGFEQLLVFEPELSKTHNSLAVVLGQLGESQKALNFLNRAIELEPDYSEAYLNRAQLLYNMDKSNEQVCGDIEKALILNPALDQKVLGFEKLLEPYGNLRFKILELVERCGGKALEQTLILQATGYELINHYDKAREYYKKYLALNPDHFWYEIKLATLHPAIYMGKEEIDFHRQRISQELEKLSHKYVNNRELILQCPLPEKFTSYLFYLAYHGLNDKDLFSQCGKLWEQIFAQIFTPKDFNKRTTASPIKVGFISTYFRKHSVMTCFWELIKALAYDGQFEVNCISLSKPNEGDEFTREVKATVQNLSYIPFGLNCYQTILDKQLDLIVYTDIGMEPITYLTAQWRLAPVQVVLAGHPVTTGSMNMDYYISSDLCEVEHAQNYYSESVFKAKTIGVSYPKPTLPDGYKTRTELGWPEDKNIYFCPMTLFKVHPEFDFIIKDILTQDANGIVFFVHDDQKVYSRDIWKRFEQNIPEVLKQIHFMDWIPFDDYLQLLFRADVILDTIHFGGGNTIYQSLAVGTPMVSWPSPFLRGRGAYGLYKLMGVMDCLADNHQDYAALAVKIATNKSYQQELRQKILSNHSVLFNNSDGPAELINFFKTIVENNS